MVSQEHTLEVLVNEAKKKEGNKPISEIEKEIYPTLLIDFVKAAEEVISEEVIPTPLFRMEYDENNFEIALTQLGGYAIPPTENSIDFDALDLTLAFALREIPLLWVGETGTGKTKTTKTFGKTVLPKGAYVYKRLAGSSGSGSLLGAFTKIDMSTGYPRPVLDEEKTKYISMLFIDEANRGRDDEKMQLIDGEISVGGKSSLLGPEIPELTENGIVYAGRRKKVFVVGAINPDNGMISSKGRNKYVGTRTLDDAEKRRWTIVEYGDIVGSAGESIDLTNENHNRFKEFLSKFTEYVSNDLEIPKDEIEKSIEDDWLSVYAYITDSKKTEHPVIYTAFEFSDVVSTILSGDLENILTSEKEVIAEVNNKLSPKYNISFNYNVEIDKESNSVKRLVDILSGLQDESPADVSKVGMLAQGIKTIRDIKAAFASDNPIEYYKKLQESNDDKNTYNAVNIADVAYAWAMVASSKSLSLDGRQEVISLMNELLNEYKSMELSFQKNIYKNTTPMNLNDTTRGIRLPAIIKGIKYAKKNVMANPNNNDYVDYMIKAIAYEGNVIANNTPSSAIAQTLTGRVVSDLAVFSEFLDEYKNEINNKLNKNPNLSEYEVIDVIHDVYEEMKVKHARSMPVIYQHRIPKILGLSA